MPRPTQDDRYQYYMNLVDQDPEAAGKQFYAELQRSPKKTKKTIDAMNQLRQILAGEQEAWQKGSGVRDMADAIRFVISNSLLSAMGMGVIPQRGSRYMESIADDVANTISEDINFAPLSAEQRRLKMLAESYGYSVFLLPEEDQSSAE